MITLPAADGTLYDHVPSDPVAWVKPDGPPTSRVAFAAAHVVADPLGDNSPGAPAVVDWDSTLAFRRHLWSYGLGVAEAMDTAQRGMGLDWATTRELIRRSAAEAGHLGTRIAAGAGTDHADPATLDDVVRAYTEQLDVVQDAGAQVIVMASRHLARLATGPADYRHVYDRILPHAGAPVVLHWLGPMFDPALEGYWGSSDVDEATSAFLDLVHHHADRIDGVKVSLLNADHEKALRANLPAGVRLYTGDDFNYPDLVKGDGAHHSDALLGIFAAIAPAASRALQALDAGDEAGYDAAFAPTLPLARHVFGPPTYYYKTGIAFLAWLSGLQPGFSMVAGLHSARGLPHLVETYVLADRAGLFPDPELAAYRLSSLLDVHGVVR
ncbi:dihydrodipicolinate synthase family protein [Umezawaea sp. Da 62-37]|uniref:dihydrodipicolinate synthase family protein n=1 Tax=Umezawaea sp. Da 62-37 TaxID=3075927 RepID=UPI0028F7001C|nr:dihydrodipicolinate synthase family protein [Umezawaea sp. Da 62-37]WNV85763.1 dihydrodipicolinate synthase family protein [Umezawaea sp. Da 62-37]